MGALIRIVTSRKMQTAVAGVIGAVLVVFFDVDYTEQILGLITILTTSLVGVQGALDFKHGSPSDGTTPPTE